MENPTGCFEPIFQSVDGAIFVADADSGVLVDCNERACDLMGRGRSEIIGQHQSFLHPPEERSRYERTFKEHVEKTVVVDQGLEVARPDGKRVPVWIAAQAMSVAGKRIVVGLFIDVSGLEHLNCDEATEKRFREIVADESRGLLAVDEDGVIRFVNPAAEAFFGKSAKELLGRAFGVPVIEPEGE